jgi:hypothetical protein
MIKVLSLDLSKEYNVINVNTALQPYRRAKINGKAKIHEKAGFTSIP